MPKTHIFWWFSWKKQLLWKNLHFVFCNSFTYDLIEFNFFVKTWNTFTLSNISILMHNNTFAADFFLKTCNFHCTVPGGLKLTISNIANHRFLENYKNYPRVPELAQIARMCFLIMHRCVMHMQRHHNHYFPNLQTPRPSTHPLKNMDHRKYAENLIFQSRFSCWFWELFELLMALE